MAITNRTELRRPGGPIGAANQVRLAYQVDREALEPLLRPLVDDAALTALPYRQSASKADEREPRGAS
jgi:hypothetical protein